MDDIHKKQIDLAAPLLIRASAICGIPASAAMMRYEQDPLIAKLFERFSQHLEAEGYIARGGQIIDATIVSVPKQRNTEEENEAIRAGKTPEGWEKQPAKNAQKDKDALDEEERRELLRRQEPSRRG